MKAASVYRFYADDETLLYVGVTTNALNRLKVHAGEKDWWPDVSYVHVEHFEDKRLAFERELALIQNEAPVHNHAYKVPSHGKPRNLHPLPPVDEDQAA